MLEIMADPVLIVTISTINHTDIDPLLLHEGSKTLPQLFKDGRAVKPEHRPISFLRSHKLALAGLGLIYVEQAGLELAVICLPISLTLD